MTNRFTQIGLIGLGPMGLALSSNLQVSGWKVIGYDQDTSVRAEASAVSKPALQVSTSVDELVSTLDAPRCIFLSIPAADVDALIGQLVGRLTPGDVIADLGNSYFRDTAQRQEMLATHSINFMGVGVSGGPDGARNGPSIMAGGDAKAWRRLEPVFGQIAAAASSGPCSRYFGEGGSGHFVKMVHNGIEYAHMHLITEIVSLLGKGFGLSLDQVADIFEDLQEYPPAGFLTGATAEVLRRRLPTGGHLLDHVSDSVGQKGTGRWMVQHALEHSISVPTISFAVMARHQSMNVSSPSASMVGLKAAATQPSPLEFTDTVFQTIGDGLAFAFYSAIEQGLSICTSQAAAPNGPIDRQAILEAWCKGSIVEGSVVSGMLDQPDGSTIGLQAALERVICLCAEIGLPCAGLVSASDYLGLKTGKTLPMGLIQLQRDYFGKHGLKDRINGEPIVIDWHGKNS